MANRPIAAGLDMKVSADGKTASMFTYDKLHSRNFEVTALKQ